MSNIPSSEPVFTTPGPKWLEKSVVYEIYPQSFNDSNGDGIGDIPGIIQKLDYIASLGVNAIWLNPCWESPFGDAGYDVSDFYKVAPRYGTNADLVQLFSEARRYGIRIILDLVAGHTSIEHPWFKASCAHERNPYTDWFIWTNSVWVTPPGYNPVRGHSERDAGFIPNFFYFQPALNYGYANPDPTMPWQQPIDAPGPQAVRAELKKIMKYWLDLGASGFRVDMASSLVKNDFGHRETGRLWHEIRAWFDRDYPDACLVAEWSVPKEAVPAGFHIDFLIHFGTRGYTSLFRKEYGRTVGSDVYGYSFFDRGGHGNIRDFMDSFLEHYAVTRGLGHISIPTGNHDIFPRISEKRAARDLEVVYLFLLTMPGVPFIYYGDEIGLRALQGLPSKEGGYHRTGARTPMQWQAGAPNAGFSSARARQLYLPVDEAADRPAVDTQERDPGSILNIVRQLVALRTAHPALCASGSFEPVVAEAGNPLLVYRRAQGGEELLVALNPCERAAEVVLPAGVVTAAPQVLYGAADAFSSAGGAFTVRLPGVSGGIYLLAK